MKESKSIVVLKALLEGKEITFSDKMTYKYLSGQDDSEPQVCIVGVGNRMFVTKEELTPMEVVYLPADHLTLGHFISLCNDLSDEEIKLIKTGEIWIPNLSDLSDDCK